MSSQENESSVLPSVTFWDCDSDPHSKTTAVAGSPAINAQATEREFCCGKAISFSSRHCVAVACPASVLAVHPKTVKS